MCGLVVALPPFYPEASRNLDISLGLFLATWLFSIPLVALGGLVIGMPIAAALNSLRVRGYPMWALTGAVAGALYSSLIVMTLAGLPPSKLDVVVMTWPGVLPGAMAGIYWWGSVARHEQQASAAT